MAETNTQVGGGAALEAGIADRPPSVDTQTAAPSGTSLTDINKQVANEGGTPSFQARPGERDTTLEEANRAKMLASGELTAGGNEQLAQEKVNLFTYGVEAPEFGATVSSDGARQQFADDTGKLKDDFATTQAQLNQSNQFGQLDVPEFQLFEDFRGDFEQNRKDTKDIFERTVENIEQDFEVREAEQRDINRKQAGFQSKNLARMGAFGRTGSGLSFMKSVDDQNQRELNKLMVQKGQVLIAAAEAAASRDLEALSAAVGHSQALTNQFNAIQQQRFEDQIMAADQVMEQNRFGWETEDRAMGKISQFFDLGIDPTDEARKEDIKELEETAGLPEGSYARIFELNQQEAAQQATADALAADLEFAKNLADILKDVPEGRSVKIGESIYTGFKTGNIWEGTSTDNRGNVTGLTYDESTGKWSSHSFGNIGAAKDGNKMVQGQNGQWYNVNTQTNEVSEVVSKGQTINPENFGGFTDWANSMGGITQGMHEDHFGVDIAPAGAKAGQYSVEAFLPEGTTSGTVVEIHGIDDNDFGKYVVVEDDEKKLWRYAHLDSVGVEKGATIDANNTYLGQMGNSGRSYSANGGDGTHTHVQLYQPGANIGGSTKKEEGLNDEEKAFQKDHQNQIDLIQSGKKTVDQARAYLKTAYGMSDAQVDSALNGITDQNVGTQFLNEDFIRDKFSRNELEEAAKQSGFTEGGFLGIGVGDEGVNNYINSLNSRIESLRKSGLSDEEIFQELFEE